MEALTKKLAALEKQAAIASSTLAATLQERDKLSEEAKEMLAAAHAELEVHQAECISLQASRLRANEELDALRRKLSETEMRLAESQPADATIVMSDVIQKKGPYKALHGARPPSAGGDAIILLIRSSFLM
jgi:hypothetical protein